MPDEPEDDDRPCLHCELRETIRAYRAKYHPSSEEEFMGLAAVTTELIMEMYGPLPEDGLAPDAERPSKPH